MTMALTAATRSTVWNTYNSITLGQAPCYCCAYETCSQANFECGHVIAKSRGGDDTIQNLRPICSRCNKSMKTRNMREYAREYGLIGRIVNEVEIPLQPIGHNFLEAA